MCDDDFIKENTHHDGHSKKLNHWERFRRTFGMKKNVYRILPESSNNTRISEFHRKIMNEKLPNYKMIEIWYFGEFFRRLRELPLYYLVTIMSNMCSFKRWYENELIFSFEAVAKIKYNSKKDKIEEVSPLNHPSYIDISIEFPIKKKVNHKTYRNQKKFKFVNIYYGESLKSHDIHEETHNSKNYKRYTKINIDDLF